MARLTQRHPWGMPVPDLPWFVYLMLLGPLLLVLGCRRLQNLAGPRRARMAGSRRQGGGLRSRGARDQVSTATAKSGYRNEQRNYANIIYEYSVAGQKLRNNRVSIGEDRGNFEVAETIAKYPVGAIVTVYYNPLHPKEAVLERDLPKGLWGCLGIGTVIVLAIVFGSAFGLNKLSRIRRDASRRSQTVAAGDRLRRVRLRHRAVRARASEAGVAGEEMAGRDGTIKLSGIEQYRAARTTRTRGQMMYQRKVSYTYIYNNNSTRACTPASPATSRRVQTG